MQQQPFAREQFSKLRLNNPHSRWWLMTIDSRMSLLQKLIIGGVK